MAFFVGKNGSSDGIDAFVTQVLTAGFGSGGEAAEIEVLQRIFQVLLILPLYRRPCESHSNPIEPCACLAEGGLQQGMRMGSMGHKAEFAAGAAGEGGRALGLGGQGDGVGGAVGLCRLPC